MEAEEKEFIPIQNEEEFEELEFLVSQGKQVQKMVETEGWQKVVKPAIDSKITSLLSSFQEVTDYKDFVHIQQAINALENVVSICRIAVENGIYAQKRIEQQRQANIKQTQTNNLQE